MKMDLYLQSKIDGSLLKIEGLEISDELIGTWDNKRATIEIPKEQLTFQLENYKGVARLYNKKRQGRKHFDPKKGWELVYYYPQHIYTTGRPLKHYALPFLRYIHGGQDTANILISSYPKYDLFRFAELYFFQKAYTTRARGYHIVHRFYLPPELSGQNVIRHFISFYEFGLDITVDGISTVKFPFATRTTDFFRSGYFYAVFWYYANYTYPITVQGEGVYIKRSDGASISLSPSLSEWNPYSNDLYGILTYNTSTLPSEDMWVWWGIENNANIWWNILDDLSLNASQYTNGELYDNSYDEQVFFVEKITFSDEESNEKRYTYTIELSDISQIENIVAPFSINYKEETIRDTTMFGQATHYTKTTAILGNLENRIRALIYYFGMLDARIELDYVFPIIGIENDYTWVKYNKSIWLNIQDGQTIVVPYFVDENTQVYIRLFKDLNSRVFWQVIILWDYGAIWQSNWRVESGTTIGTIHFSRPMAVISNAWHLYWTVDLQADDTDGNPTGKTKFCLLKYAENVFTAPVLTIVDFDTITGRTYPTGGYSVFTIISQPAGWRILAFVRGNWNSGLAIACLLFDRDLSLMKYFFFADQPLGYWLGVIMRWETDFYDLDMDAFEIVPDVKYKVAVKGNGFVLGQVEFTSPTTGTTTLDGGLRGITAIRKLASENGWLAGWKTGILYWRQDLPHNSLTPLYAWYIELGTEIQDISAVWVEINGALARWGYIIVGKNGKVFATPPNFKFSDVFAGFNEQVVVGTNVFKEVGESFELEAKGWNFPQSSLYHHNKAIRIYYPGKVIRRSVDWTGNSKVILGVMLKDTLQLWNCTYQSLTFLGLSDVFIKTRKEQKAGMYDSLQSWDFYGKQEQGHYILTFIHDWDIDDGRYLEIQAWDIQIEKIYVKQILAGGYLEQTIWDYVGDNDFIIVDDIETAKDLINRVETKSRIREILRAKTFQIVRVGDKVDIWNGNTPIGRYKIHEISVDNQGIITFTAVKL